MLCLHCGEQSRLRDQIKFWLISMVPFSWYMWLEGRREQREMEELKRLYSMDTLDARLTEREHLVCTFRINNVNIESIAKSMNVTRERVRQIQAKALRKMRGQG